MGSLVVVTVVVKRSRRIRKSRSRANRPMPWLAEEEVTSPRPTSSLLEHPGLDSYMIDWLPKGGSGEAYRRGRLVGRGRHKVYIVPIDEGEYWLGRRNTPCAEGDGNAATWGRRCWARRRTACVVTKPLEPPRGRVLLRETSSSFTRSQSGDNQGSTGRECTWQPPAAPDRCWETGTVDVALCDFLCPTRRRPFDLFCCAATPAKAP